MAKQVINFGNSLNDGTGDSIRVGALKINENFTELYNALESITSGNIVLSVTSDEGISVSSRTGNIVVSNSMPNKGTFKTIKVNEQPDLEATGITDVLTFCSDQNVKITSDTTTKTITISLPSYTGDVVGNVTGNVVGAVVGNVTGNLNGNVSGNVSGDVVDTQLLRVTGNGAQVLEKYQELVNRQTAFLGQITEARDQLSVVRTQISETQADLETWKADPNVDSSSTMIEKLTSDILVLLEKASGLTNKADMLESQLYKVEKLMADLKPDLNQPRAEMQYDAVNRVLSSNKAIQTPGVVLTSMPCRLASLTTEQRNTLIPVNGDMIYNASVNKIQGYQNNSWINLDGTPQD